MKEKLLVVHSKRGSIEKIELIEYDNLPLTVKSLVSELLNLWDPSASDFIVTKEEQTFELDLPLPKDMFNILRKYNLRRSRDKAYISLPMYEISYDNVWREDKIEIRSVVIVTPYINEKIKDETIEYAKLASSPIEE